MIYAVVLNGMLEFPRSNCKPQTASKLKRTTNESNSPDTACLVFPAKQTGVPTGQNFAVSHALAMISKMCFESIFVPYDPFFAVTSLLSLHFPNYYRHLLKISEATSYFYIGQLTSHKKCLPTPLLSLPNPSLSNPQPSSSLPPAVKLRLPPVVVAPANPLSATNQPCHCS